MVCMQTYCAHMCNMVPSMCLYSPLNDCTYLYVQVHKATQGDVCTHVSECCLKFAVHIFHVPVTWQSVSVLHDHNVDVCVQHM